MIALKIQVSTQAQTTAAGRADESTACWAGQTDAARPGTGPGVEPVGTARASGAGRVVPSNQSRAGCSHSIAAEAATTDETKPPVTMPVRKRGTASTVSASRALRLRRSTW